MTRKQSEDSGRTAGVERWLSQQSEVMPRGLQSLRDWAQLLSSSPSDIFGGEKHPFTKLSVLWLVVTSVQEKICPLASCVIISCTKSSSKSVPHLPWEGTRLLGRPPHCLCTSCPQHKALHPITLKCTRPVQGWKDERGLSPPSALLPFACSSLLFLCHTETPLLLPSPGHTCTYPLWASSLPLLLTLVWFLH